MIFTYFHFKTIYWVFFFFFFFSNVFEFFIFLSCVTNYFVILCISILWLQLQYIFSVYGLSVYLLMVGLILVLIVSIVKLTGLFFYYLNAFYVLVKKFLLTLIYKSYNIISKLCNLYFSWGFFNLLKIDFCVFCWESSLIFFPVCRSSANSRTIYCMFQVFLTDLYISFCLISKINLYVCVSVSELLISSTDLFVCYFDNTVFKLLSS